MKESIVFTFPYQTNANHATEQHHSQSPTLRMTLEKYFRFH